MLNGAELRPGSKLANFKAKVMYLRTCPLEKFNVPRISETVLCSLYFCSVSFDGCSPGGRRGMTNSKITRLKHRNLDLTHLICNAPSREKKNIFSFGSNYEFKSCHLENSQVTTVKTEVSFCILLYFVHVCAKLLLVRGDHSRKHLLCVFPWILHFID